ncbi:MAG TPA: hypothetical protein VML75_27845 [Kofleriaceae bacterium]|nr:hypothetical protein [Kofleriaceae bacterium]
MRTLSLLLVLVSTTALLACGSKAKNIPGTHVGDDPVNREIIDVLEAYRVAVERKDAAGLFLMASPEYWEDGGTASGKDDYGYKQLKDVLSGRFQAGSDIRYSMRYMTIAKRCPPDSEGREGCRAYIDVLVDASFSVIDARGAEIRRDKRDQNQIVLVWNGDAWKILSGM